MLAYILALAVGLGSLGIYLAAFFFPEIHRKKDFYWSGVGLFYALILWVCAGRITGALLLGQVASVALLGWSVTQTLQLRRQLTPKPQQTELPSAAEVKNNVQEQISKLSLPQRLSQWGKRVSGSATAAKDRLQQVTDGSKRQSQSEDSTAIDVPESAAIAAPPPSPTTEVNPSVQVIDNRNWTPEQTADSAATAQPATDMDTESVPENEAVYEPALTEEEAIAQAIEATLAEDTTTETTELHRPNPPDPELVEAALEDAEEKHLEASPPETAEHDSAQTDKPAESP